MGFIPKCHNDTVQIWPFYFISVMASCELVVRFSESTDYSLEETSGDTIKWGSSKLCRISESTAKKYEKKTLGDTIKGREYEIN